MRKVRPYISMQAVGAGISAMVHDHFKIAVGRARILSVAMDIAAGSRELRGGRRNLSLEGHDGSQGLPEDCRAGFRQ